MLLAAVWLLARCLARHTPRTLPPQQFPPKLWRAFSPPHRPVARHKSSRAPTGHPVRHPFAPSGDPRSFLARPPHRRAPFRPRPATNTAPPSAPSRRPPTPLRRPATPPLPSAPGSKSPYSGTTHAAPPSGHPSPQAPPLSSCLLGFGADVLAELAARFPTTPPASGGRTSRSAAASARFQNAAASARFRWFHPIPQRRRHPVGASPDPPPLPSGRRLPARLHHAAGLWRVTATAPTISSATRSPVGWVRQELAAPEYDFSAVAGVDVDVYLLFLSSGEVFSQSKVDGRLEKGSLQGPRFPPGAVPDAWHQIEASAVGTVAISNS